MAANDSTERIHARIDSIAERLTRLEAVAVVKGGSFENRLNELERASIRTEAAAHAAAAESAKAAHQSETTFSRREKVIAVTLTFAMVFLQVAAFFAGR